MLKVSYEGEFSNIHIKQTEPHMNPSHYLNQMKDIAIHQ